MMNFQKRPNYAAANEGRNEGGVKSPEVTDAVGGTAQIAGEIVQESLKMRAWKRWLEETGYALGRKDDDIEMDGDIVTVKIPGHPPLVFNPAEYKIGDQTWTANDKEGQERGSGNKFSREDFAYLLKFLGGNNWSGGKKVVGFLKNVLGLKTGEYYWSSSRNNVNHSKVWGLNLTEENVFILDSSLNINGRHTIASAIISQK